VNFVPALPDPVRAAIASLGCGPVARLVLRFSEPGPWRTHAGLRDHGYVHTPSGPLRRWWTTQPVRSGVLVGWAGGPAAAALAGVSQGELVAGALASLAAELGTSAAELHGALLRAHYHDWSADPFARGGYSYVAAGAEDAPATLARPVADRLFFAGEATHEGAELGTVHGAVQTGERAATLVLRSAGR
jgi:monoamine oxidase